jgi:hypothetical protein
MAGGAGRALRVAKGIGPEVREGVVGARAVAEISGQLAGGLLGLVVCSVACLLARAVGKGLM